MTVESHDAIHCLDLDTLGVAFVWASIQISSTVKDRYLFKTHFFALMDRLDGHRHYVAFDRNDVPELLDVVRRKSSLKLVICIRKRQFVYVYHEVPGEILGRGAELLQYPIEEVVVRWLFPPIVESPSLSEITATVLLQLAKELLFEVVYQRRGDQVSSQIGGRGIGASLVSHDPLQLILSCPLLREVVGEPFGLSNHLGALMDTLFRRLESGLLPPFDALWLVVKLRHHSVSGRLVLALITRDHVATASFLDGLLTLLHESNHLV